jgi:hypothetical protein
MRLKRKTRASVNIYRAKGWNHLGKGRCTRRILELQLIAIIVLNLLGPDREEQAFSLSTAERWYPTMTDQKNRHASLLAWILVLLINSLPQRLHFSHWPFGPVH